MKAFFTKDVASVLEMEARSKKGHVTSPINGPLLGLEGALLHTLRKSEGAWLPVSTSLLPTFIQVYL